MSTKGFGLNLQKGLCIALAVILLAVIFLYYQSTLTPKSTPAVSVSETPPTQAATLPDKPKAEPKNPIPITPEEKRVVAEREKLEAIVAAGKDHISALQAEEQALYEQDQQAQAAIEKLEAQVKGRQ